jgi:ABC-2 type transport system permease protein
VSRLLASELLKVRTTRTAPALLAVSTGLGVLTAVLIIQLSSTLDISGPVGARLVLSSGGIVAGVIALLLGIVTTTGEHRHGTIVPTVLVTPDRRRVTLAQATAATMAGGLVGAVGVAATVIVSLPLMAARDIPRALSAGQLAAILVGGTCFAALSGTLGAALGTLLRNQVLTVALALLVLFVIEPVLTGLVEGYQRYSLVGVRTAMNGGAAESAGAATGGLPPLWLASVLWTGYALVLLLAATAAVRRRDIA